MSTIEIAFPVIPAEVLEAMWATQPSDTITLTSRGRDFDTMPLYFSHYPKTHGEVVTSRPSRFTITAKKAKIDGWHAKVRGVHLTGPFGGRALHVIYDDTIDVTLALRGDNAA